MQDRAAPVHVVFGITDVVMAIENVRGTNMSWPRNHVEPPEALLFYLTRESRGSFISLLPFSARLPSKEIEPKLSITPNICPPNVNVRYLIEVFVQPGTAHTFPLRVTMRRLSSNSKAIKKRLLQKLIL